MLLSQLVGAIWSIFIGGVVLVHGAAASATVIAVRDLGIDVNVSPLLMLELRVTPPGAAPFDAELAVNPSRLVMHTFQPGVTLRVRYDPSDRSRLALDE